MHILQTIIGSMNKEDKRNFKLFIKRTNDTGDRKDEKLFDHISKSYPEYDETLIQYKLYNKEDKNSLYQLKNRVLEEISKSIIVQYYDEALFNSILYSISLSRLFYSKSLANVGFYFLGRAEKAALKNEYYELLDLIYGELIKLSHETLEINPEDYIEKRKKNRENIAKIQQVDDLLAVLIYRIKTTQLLSTKGNTKILDILEQTVTDFLKDRSLKKSPALRLRIYHALSKILLQREDYPSLESYLAKTYHEFLKENFFNKSNHDTKLQMLTYIVNATFRNNKTDQSLAFAEKLKHAMHEYGNLLYDKYLFYYYNSLIINYSVTDTDKALTKLQEAKENPVISKNPMQVALIYHNLSLIYFDKKDYRSSLKNLLKHKMDDSFKKLDDGFKLKVSVAEIIIRYELSDLEFIERLIKNIRNQFQRLQKNNEYSRDFSLMKVVSSMIKYLGSKKQREAEKRIQEFLDNYSDEKANDVINYINWLKGKRLSKAAD